MDNKQPDQDLDFYVLIDTGSRTLAFTPSLHSWSMKGIKVWNAIQIERTIIIVKLTIFGICYVDTTQWFYMYYCSDLSFECYLYCPYLMKVLRFRELK